MKILVCEPNKKAYVKDIEHTLENLQSIVGGLIEALYPFEDDVAVVCNEEALLLDLPLNRLVDGCPIAGTFFVCGLTNDNFTGLTDAQLKKYMAMFREPQMFLRIPLPEQEAPVEPIYYDDALF